MIWHINSKINGCVDYEQVKKYAENVVFVESYNGMSILKSFFRNDIQIFQFRLRYVLIFLMFFFSKNHFLDFRTLSVSNSLAMRTITNYVIYFFLKYLRRSIADPTAFKQLKVTEGITFGLGAPLKRFTLYLNSQKPLRFIFLGSIDRPGVDKIPSLLKGYEGRKPSLDIFCSISKTQERRIAFILKDHFGNVSFHPWIEYDNIQDICSKYDAGICYLDEKIYKTQVPLKMFDYASGGLYTLCNETFAIKNYVPSDLYVTSIHRLIQLNNVEKTVVSPYDTWQSQVERLMHTLCQLK